MIDGIIRWLCQAGDLPFRCTRTTLACQLVAGTCSVIELNTPGNDWSRCLNSLVLIVSAVLPVV